MLRTSGLDHIAICVNDLQESETYYREILGFDTIFRIDGGPTWLGGEDGRCSVALCPGGADKQGAIEYFAYELGSETDLRELAAELKKEGYQVVHEPEAGPRPGSDSLGVLDPDGLIVRLVVSRKGMVCPSPLEKSSKTCSISPKKLGHVVIKVSDTKKSENFYLDLLGLKVTEYNELGLVFMRCTPLHHDLGLMPLPEGSAVGLHHMAFDIGAIPDLARADCFLREKNIRIEKGPGFWNQGGHVELYFFDPDLHAIELYVNMRRYKDEQLPETTPSFYRTVTIGEPEVRKEFQKF